VSEYQYYEFQAVDRPFTAAEMLEVRAYSTRARITRSGKRPGFTQSQQS
jgi:hypothetical protein